jgi:hypothetical protein
MLMHDIFETIDRNNATLLHEAVILDMKVICLLPNKPLMTLRSEIVST